MWPRLLVLGLLLGSLVACETFLYPRFEGKMWRSYLNLQEIQPGMTKDEVLARMGNPEVAEEAERAGEKYTIWLYRTHTMDMPGSETVRGGLTPLVFKDNRVVGIGQRAYARIMGTIPQDTLRPTPYELTR